MPDIISKFTAHLKNALTRALCLVIETKGDHIDPIHLLWALTTQQGSVAAEVLVKSSIDIEALRSRAGDLGTIAKDPGMIEQNFMPVLSEESKNALEKAVLTANIYEHRYVGTEHLLAGLLQIASVDVQTFFEQTKLDTRRVRMALSAVFKTSAAFPEFPESQRSLLDSLQDSDPLSLEDASAEEESKTPAIEYFTQDLTDPERVKEFTPVVGRDNEIARLTRILCRRQKNNPILVGKPGVGKTAIVEGLAKLIVDGNVPPALQGRRILQLDLASMIAGTMYRGEFESRLRQLIDEVTDRPEIILFIDELHSIMGAGAASGSLDAANILKPALARGEIHCIGATTLDEFKKHIETDGAFERRFQPIPVREPNAKETERILEGVKRYYEQHHGVAYSEQIIRRVVELAERYFPGKAFPDKAIDILDEAGASATMNRREQSTKQTIARELESIREEKQKAVHDEHFAEAIELKKQEEKLELDLKRAQETKSQIKTSIITEDILFSVVADMCGIPLFELAASEQKGLSQLEKKLKARVIGQNKVVETVSRAVRRAKLGLSRREEPLASFLFLGPSGVGKTHLAKCLAAIHFRDPDAFLRLDMSEYAEPYAVSKLIGSPAGYVGYRERTKLTDHVKNHPHSIILLDEIEKAHRDVHSLLLQILDDGTITDATGRKINFRNTIIVMTTNAGREYFERGTLGFSSNHQTSTDRERDIREKLEDAFASEFLNRIRHICVFEPLSPVDLVKIAKLEIQKLTDRLQERNMRCHVDPTVAKTLASLAKNKQGAREIHKLIEEKLEQEITNILLNEDDAPSDIKIVTDKRANILVKVV